MLRGVSKGKKRIDEKRFMINVCCGRVRVNKSLLPETGGMFTLRVDLYVL